MSFTGKISALGLVCALSGCGLPPVVTALSYAVEGVSFAASGKSTTDHALSAAVERDCALFRMVKGEQICRGDEEQSPADGTMLAMAEESVDVTDSPTLLASAEPVLFSYGVDNGAEWQIEPGTGISAEGPVAVAADETTLIQSGQPPVRFNATESHPDTASLWNFSANTEVYALLQENGTLEIFTYEATPGDPDADLTMVASYENYADDPDVLTGITINRAFFAIEDLMV